MQTSRPLNPNFKKKKHPRVIAQGASATVYLCRLQRDGREFALKELSVLADADARHAAVTELLVVSRLELAYRSICRLRTYTHTAHAEGSRLLSCSQHAEIAHSHIVRFYDAFFDEGYCRPFDTNQTLRPPVGPPPACVTWSTPTCPLRPALLCLMYSLAGLL